MRRIAGVILMAAVFAVVTASAAQAIRVKNACASLHKPGSHCSTTLTVRPGRSVYLFAMVNHSWKGTHAIVQRLRPGAKKWRTFGRQKNRNGRLGPFTWNTTKADRTHHKPWEFRFKAGSATSNVVKVSVTRK